MWRLVPASFQSILALCTLLSFVLSDPCFIDAPHLRPSCSADGRCVVPCAEAMLSFQCAEYFDVNQLCISFVESGSTRCQYLGSSVVQCSIVDGLLPSGLPDVSMLDYRGHALTPPSISFAPNMFAGRKNMKAFKLFSAYIKGNTLNSEVFGSTRHVLTRLTLIGAYGLNLDNASAWQYPAVRVLIAEASELTAINMSVLTNMQQLYHLSVADSRILKVDGASCGCSLGITNLRLGGFSWRDFQTDLVNMTFPPVDIRGLRILKELELFTTGTLEAWRLPQYNHITQLNIPWPGPTHVALDALYGSLNLQQVSELDLGGLVCKVNNNSWTVQSAVSCDCISPPFRDATHCPRVDPESLTCGTVSFSPLQVCDGTADCEDGRDEATCVLQLAAGRRPTCADNQTDGMEECGLLCLEGMEADVSRGQLRSRARVVGNCSHHGVRQQEYTCSLVSGVVVGWDMYEGAAGYDTLRLWRHEGDVYLMERRHRDATWGHGRVSICTMPLLTSSPSAVSSVILDELAAAPTDGIVDGDMLSCVPFPYTPPPATTVAPETTEALVEGSVLRKSRGQGAVIAVGVCVGVVVMLVVIVVLVVSRHQQKRSLKDRQQSLQDILTSAIDSFLALHPLDGKQSAGEVRQEMRLINRDELVEVGRLGSGHFSSVVKCQHHDVSVAVKALSAEGRDSPQAAKTILTEACLLHLLGAHPNILSLYGVIADVMPPSIVLELAGHGDLLTWLRSHAHMSEGSSVQVMQQVASALTYAHDRGIIHRDVACRNVLVFEATDWRVDRVKVADFGLSHMFEQGTSEYYHVQRLTDLPFRWLPLEALTNGKFGKASDIWSFGVFVYELLTFGALPYESLSSCQELVRFLLDGKRLELPPSTSPHVHDLVSRCWSKSTSLRADCLKDCMNMTIAPSAYNAWQQSDNGLDEHTC